MPHEASGLFSALERPATAPASPARFLADLGTVYAVNGLIGFIFAATGPVAVILAVGTRGGLGPSDLASWVFGAFFVNGLVSILFCGLYRQPLVFFWTIPGTVLVGPALGHLSYPEVIGAFIATGLLIAGLGLSGWVRRFMDVFPMAIVMAMVAGVFLRFGLDLVFALRDEFAIAAPMTIAFVVLNAVPALGRRLPPLIGALVVGAVAVALLGRFDPAAAGGLAMAPPTLYRPAFSWPAMLELVLPLAITVIVVQNGQGIAVLRAVGHAPPVNATAFACGVGSVLAGLVGSVSTCLTGPTNALISASGEKPRQYSAGIVAGGLALGFGVFSPVFTGWLLASPKGFIAALAGLAMLRVLQTAFGIAFRDRFTLGSTITFIASVADVPIASIGAPFWALVLGFAVSWLLERGDFRSTKG